MNDDLRYPINYASRQTGLTAHQIRAWERRYAAVVPERTASNRRMYSEADIVRLKLLTKARQSGHSLEQLAALSSEDLMRLLNADTPHPATPTPRPTPIPTQAPELDEGVSPNSWEGKYQALFRNRCGSCHGATAVGGLNMATYENALAGGDNGLGIVPGDPDASTVVQIQIAGGHPGQLTAEELEEVIAWIEAGAPER